MRQVNLWDILTEGGAEEVPARVMGIIIVVLAVMFLIGYCFNVQERRAIENINAWRTTAGLDSIKTLKGW